MRWLAVMMLVCIGSMAACSSSEPSEGSEATSGTEGECKPDDPCWCEMLIEAGDYLYPGDCECAEPGAPCMQGCFTPDDTTTCTQICEGLGQTCVQAGCEGSTYIGGDPGQCPSGDWYGYGADVACDEPVPIVSFSAEPIDFECCCTRS